MLMWVVYDIVKDRTRTKIAKRCLDYGLVKLALLNTLVPIAGVQGLPAH
jgi:hypothetical protein